MSPGAVPEEGTVTIGDDSARPVMGSEDLPVGCDVEVAHTKARSFLALGPEACH